MTRPDEIVDFWVHDVGPEGWYNGPPELDATIRQRFMGDWQKALEGGYTKWTETAEGSLAYLILTDQFPRNMFRDDPRAYSTDALARAAAKAAILRDFDLQVGRAAQEFFYMPLEHSEDLDDQILLESYMSTRMTDNEGSLLHARVHQEIIRQFGRFPYRNKPLGRVSSKAEVTFLTEGGYQGILKKLESQA